LSSSEKQPSLLILHGAVLLLLGLLSGLPAVAEELAGVQPTIWRAAHGALLLAGVWLLASGPALPFLVLPPARKRVLCWSLVGTGYAFAAAVLIQAITGVRALSPHGTLSSWIAYLANLATVFTGLFAALLTLLGARAALRERQG